jgi:iron complex outermembrane receptor protein
MSIFFNVENLADISYQSHLSRLKYAPINPVTGKYGIFNQGRNISLKILLNI